MIKVLHLATGLGMGGAETSLLNLLTHTDRAAFEPHVLALGSDQPVGDRIRALGIPVTSLGMRPSVPDPLSFIRLARFLRALKPDIIQTWMYHADLLGMLAAPLAGNIPVAWGIHLTLGNLAGLKLPTRLVIRASALLSRRPAAIVCCAESARKTHAAIGYDGTRMQVIPNGFDLGVFQPDPAARASLRAELGLPSDAPLIGMAARFHPQKDHQTFIRAAGLLHAGMPEVHFVLWGREVDGHNRTLEAWIDAAGIGANLHLLGLRQDAPRLTAGLDLATLSSAWGEAFPMVLGEAMACGVPCVATDVGDAAEMLADTGRIVPPGNPRALADAWSELLHLPATQRRTLGQATRRRVTEHYDIRLTARMYARLHRDIITGGAR